MSPDSINSKNIIYRIKYLYGDKESGPISKKIFELIRLKKNKIPGKVRSKWSEKDAFLITYGNTLLDSGPTLKTLGRFLNKYVKDVFSFVHLLPFYPYTSDDGFSVVNYKKVRENHGTWKDIVNLAQSYRIVFDGVINHVSATSTYMIEYCKGNPKFKDFFIEVKSNVDTSKVTRPRNLPLINKYNTILGEKSLWTTFSEDQIDLNFKNPDVLIEILDVILTYAEYGASMIRLDAIPYLWKELGTNCVHLPQTHELIKLINDVLLEADANIILLAEINGPHEQNLSYLGNSGDEAQIIYNFTLSPLILWSLFKGDASILSKWAGGLKNISKDITYLNMTATHDGIGLRPTEGILNDAQRNELVKLSQKHGGTFSSRTNPDGSTSPYELNINYYDILNDPNNKSERESLKIKRFMLAQTIPLSMLGMPAVYIHSFIGSRNDYAAKQLTKSARSINRQKIIYDILCQDLDNPDTLRYKVYNNYVKLLKFRLQESAFHPNADQKIIFHTNSLFIILRHNTESGNKILAIHNVSNTKVNLSIKDLNFSQISEDIITNLKFDLEKIKINPYQVLWLKSIQ